MKTYEKDGKLYIEDRFSLNESSPCGRIYTKEGMEKAVEACQKAITERRMGGTMGFSDYTIKLSDVSHLVTQAEVDPYGNLIMTCEVVDSPAGRDLGKYLAKFGVIGLAVRPVGQGIAHENVVQGNYKLMTCSVTLDDQPDDPWLTRYKINQRVAGMTEKGDT